MEAKTLNPTPDMVAEAGEKPDLKGYLDKSAGDLNNYHVRIVEGLAKLKGLEGEVVDVSFTDEEANGDGEGGHKAAEELPVTNEKLQRIEKELAENSKRMEELAQQIKEIEELPLQFQRKDRLESLKTEFANLKARNLKLQEGSESERAFLNTKSEISEEPEKKETKLMIDAAGYMNLLADIQGLEYSGYKIFNYRDGAGFQVAKDVSGLEGNNDAASALMNLVGGGLGKMMDFDSQLRRKVANLEDNKELGRLEKEIEALA